MKHINGNITYIQMEFKYLQFKIRSGCGYPNNLILDYLHCNF